MVDKMIPPTNKCFFIILLISELHTVLWFCSLTYALKKNVVSRDNGSYFLVNVFVVLNCRPFGVITG